MKAKTPLFALFVLLLFSTLAVAEEVSVPETKAVTVTSLAVEAPVPLITLPPVTTSTCAAADPITLAASPIRLSLVCFGVEYPGCFPGGSCLDPCCYCECRADGQAAGLCSFECCRGH